MHKCAAPDPAEWTPQDLHPRQCGVQTQKWLWPIACKEEVNLAAQCRGWSTQSLAGVSSIILQCRYIQRNAHVRAAPDPNGMGHDTHNLTKKHTQLRQNTIPVSNTGISSAMHKCAAPDPAEWTPQDLHLWQCKVQTQKWWWPIACKEEVNLAAQCRGWSTQSLAGVSSIILQCRYIQRNAHVRAAPDPNGMGHDTHNLTKKHTQLRQNTIPVSNTGISSAMHKCAAPDPAEWTPQDLHPRQCGVQTQKWLWPIACKEEVNLAAQCRGWSTQSLAGVSSIILQCRYIQRNAHVRAAPDPNGMGHDTHNLTKKHTQLRQNTIPVSNTGISSAMHKCAAPDPAEWTPQDLHLWQCKVQTQKWWWPIACKEEVNLAAQCRGWSTQSLAGVSSIILQCRYIQRNAHVRAAPDPNGMGHDTHNLTKKHTQLRQNTIPVSNTGISSAMHKCAAPDPAEWTPQDLHLWQCKVQTQKWWWPIACKEEVNLAAQCRGWSTQSLAGVSSIILQCRYIQRNAHVRAAPDPNGMGHDTHNLTKKHTQ